MRSLHHNLVVRPNVQATGDAAYKSAVQTFVNTWLASTNRISSSSSSASVTEGEQEEEAVGIFYTPKVGAGWLQSLFATSVSMHAVYWQPSHGIVTACTMRQRATCNLHLYTHTHKQGLAKAQPGGSLQHTANAAFLVLAAADSPGVWSGSSFMRHACWVRNQIGYMLVSLLQPEGLFVRDPVGTCLWLNVSTYATYAPLDSPTWPISSRCFW